MKEEKLKQKRLEFLEDTIKYYSEDVSRRSFYPYLVPSDCAYRGDNGAKCAIGRHIPDKKYSALIEGHSVNSDIVLNKLPKSISNLGGCFLEEIQFLHDGSEFWNKTGLTEKGMEYVEKIKNMYIL